MLFTRAHRLLSSPRWPAGPLRHLGHDVSLRSRHSLGRNLSERYQRLERSLRQKELLRDIDDLASSSLANPAVADAIITIAPDRRPETFHGFLVPKEPQPPRDDECCMSNCAICVYDLYEESLEAYRKAASDLRSSLLALGVPEAEWPKNIRSSGAQVVTSRKDVVRNAFEEMERALMKKRQLQSQDASANPNAHSPPDPAIPSSLRAARRSRARATSWVGSPARLYEGVQWLLFSNR